VWDDHQLLVAGAPNAPTVQEVQTAADNLDRLFSLAATTDARRVAGSDTTSGRVRRGPPASPSGVPGLGGSTMAMMLEAIRSLTEAYRTVVRTLI